MSVHLMSMIAMRAAYVPNPRVRIRESARVVVGASNDVFRQANLVILHADIGVNAAQRQIMLAIGNFESEFGLTGSWLKSDGTPSYNWGALVGSGTAGSISHGDHTASGEPVTYGFKAFNSMDQGFSSFWGTWNRPDTIAAAAKGDAYGVAKAMYGHHYFTGTQGNAEDRIKLYASAILASAKQAAAAIGEPLAVKAGGGSNWFWWALGLGAVGYGAYTLVR